MPRNFREYMAAITPTWLRGFWGERLMGALALLTDISAESQTQAVKASWLRTNTSPDDGLAEAGEDANIQRVAGETADNYRLRILSKWRLWEESATRDFAENSFAPFGVAASQITLKTPLNWRPVNPDNWSRWWIVLEEPLPWSRIEWGGSPPGSWGSGDATWGSTATQDEIFGVMRLLCKWKSGHEVGVKIYLLFGDHGIWGGPDPETWGEPGKVWGNTDVIIWRLGRFWGGQDTPLIWGDPTDTYRPFPAIWGGKIRV